MDVEYLVALAEPADDVVDVTPGMLEHFGHRSLAKIESVIGTRHDADELLEPVDAAQYAMNAAVSFICRHARIVRMTAEPNFVLRGHRDDPLQEILDALPHLF